MKNHYGGKMKKVLDNVHLLIDNNLGQDYVFDGCMAYLMECLGESNHYDYWFFSGVSGDIYTQVYQQGLDTRIFDFSHACFHDDLLRRVFRAVGYDYSFVTGSELEGNLEKYRRQVVDSIDQGVPVIAKGFDFSMGGKTYRNIDIGCIVGYVNAGETLLSISQDSVIPSPHMANDPIIPRPFVLDPSYCLVFAGKKNQAPPLANVYTEAIRNIPRHNTMPERDGIFFGTKAFEQWATDLENGKFGSISEDKLDFWPHYGEYLVILYTNIFGQHFTQRAIDICPELTVLSEVLSIIKEMSKVCDFTAAGGGFDMEPRKLKDHKHMEPICKLIRKCASYNQRIVDTIERAG
jgi:hypothetical protein